MEDFHRIRRLPPYVFETVNRAKAVGATVQPLQRPVVPPAAQ